MSERENTQPNERLKHLSSKVMTAEEFDARVESDAEFRSRIAGFNSQGIGAVLRGLQAEPYAYVPYGVLRPNINIELTEKGYATVFGQSADFPHPSLPEQISLNRDYGRSNTLHELVSQSAPRSQQEIEEIWMERGFMDIMMEFFAKPEGASQLTTALAQKEALPLDEDDDTALQRATRLAQDFGLSQESILAIERKMQVRNGVQVVVGPPDKFAAWLEVSGSHAEPIDDFSVSIDIPLPEDLILAVIPLGEYEKGQLLPLK